MHRTGGRWILVFENFSLFKRYFWKIKYFKDSRSESQDKDSRSVDISTAADLVVPVSFRNGPVPKTLGRHLKFSTGCYKSNSVTLELHSSLSIIIIVGPGTKLQSELDLQPSADGYEAPN